MPVRDASSNPEFSVAVSQEDGRARVAVGGEVDLFTSPRLQAEVEKQLARGAVLLDLSAVTFLDSSGIRVLDALMRRDGDLRVSDRLAANVKQVLELTGMLDVLPLEEA